MTPAHQFDVPPKRSYAIGEYSVDWSDFLANYWTAGQAYGLGNRVRSRLVKGLEWEATTAGASGTREPRWPTTVGATVSDGSIVWTCRASSNASLRTTIATSTWSADTGVTLSNDTTDGAAAMVYVGGGTDGQSYQVRNRVTFADGTRDEAELTIAVAD